MKIEHGVNTGSFSRTSSNGMKLPTPPKKGEVMICQICGKPMLPQDFSKNELERRLEFKWHVHAKCRQEVEKVLDSTTPGIAAMRKQK